MASNKKNTKIVLDEKGVLFIALYCTEVFVDPTPQDWLRIKKDLQTRPEGSKDK